VGELHIGALSKLDDPGCREFTVGEGEWPLRGFLVREGTAVFAYENRCAHLGHPLNWSPDRFLSSDGRAIVCASHGATYEIATGRCFAGPCKGRNLKRLDCEVRGGEVYVRVDESFYNDPSYPRRQ
jgi:nitrite reductase/ring-hydroxylating ferredoxin subunit